MSMRINIENILQSHKSVFHDILVQLTQTNIELSQQELEDNTDWLDQQLFDAINLTLNKLHDEESFFSCLLYRSFNIGREKNKRRDQLIILGGQLKSQYDGQHRSLNRIDTYHDNLSHSLKNLNKLREGFHNKLAFLPSVLMQERSQNYIDLIDTYLQDINEYQQALAKKKERLKSNLLLYKKLLKRIPRYHDLREETYLALIAPEPEAN